MKFYILASVFLATGCNVKDPNQTLTTIQQAHVLKIGLCPGMDKKEEALLNKLSIALKAKILTIRSHPDNLFNLLENYKIHLISCRIQKDNPWSQKVAFTTPYQSHTYVWAVPQGENAWLKYLDEFIHQNKELNR